jgi:hypothetical protein
VKHTKNVRSARMGFWFRLASAVHRDVLGALVVSLGILEKVWPSDRCGIGETPPNFAQVCARAYNSDRLGRPASVVATATGVMLTTTTYAQTSGTERRDDRRGNREGAREEKAACKAGDEKSRPECRQDKRDTKQEGRGNDEDTEKAEGNDTDKTEGNDADKTEDSDKNKTATRTRQKKPDPPSMLSAECRVRHWSQGRTVCVDPTGGSVKKADVTSRPRRCELFDYGERHSSAPSRGFRALIGPNSAPTSEVSRDCSS